MLDPSPQAALRAARPWVERLARLGYAAKGAVYVALGLLAAGAARGTGTAPEDSASALSAIRDAPFGKALLAIVAVGLVGYVLWRFVQALADPEGEGDDAKGRAKRAGFALSALIYGALAVEAARLLLGGNEGGGGADWTGRLMGAPLGRGLVGLAGLGTLGYGAAELYRAATLDFGKRLSLASLGPEGVRVVTGLGRLGLAARGVVLGLVGWFLLRAAFFTDPAEADGLGGALRTLQGAPYGPWLLGVVAAGLVAYGLFQFVEARYRQIRAA